MLGDYASLVSLVANGAVDNVVISTPLMDVSRLEQLTELCSQHHVSLARVHFKLDQLVAAS